MTLQPGGAIGVLMQSKMPFKSSCADRLGIIHDDLMRFIALVARGSNLYHRYSGKNGSTIASPVI